MDNLELCAKNDEELEGLHKIVKSFSDDTYHTNKWTWPWWKIYLGVSEGAGINHNQMKEKVKKNWS